jgi:DNA-binding SARP family transcriptional activator/tetratricopeptide (TPR) repeat protein
VSQGLHLTVLGDLAASYDGSTLDLGGRRQRAVLALLVIARGRAVPASRLVDAVWGDELPANPHGALQSYVSHLRKRMEPGVAARARAGVIVSEGPGYALRLPDDAVDAWRFEKLVQDAAGAEPAAARTLLEEALGLWRGPALAEYSDDAWAVGEALRLSRLRDVAQEQLMDARLSGGEAALLVPELEAFVAVEPLREERWRLLVLALYRSGRQADALAALRRARTTLADELGVDPGPQLRALETEVLNQSPTLQAPARQTALTTSEARDDLVDRDRELRTVQQALEAVARGGSRVLLVEGPPGIGKSRLLVEARRLAAQRGLPLLLARGSQLERDFGFGVVRQLLEPVLLDDARREMLLSGSAASSRGVFESVDLPADGSFAVLHGLYWLTVNLAAQGPVVLAVDDLQWCDSGSLRYLAYLARRLDALPVLLLGTIRTGERHADEALLADLYDVALAPVRPEPLSAEATGTLVRERLGGSAAPSFVSACHQTTAGNPLLLRQLLQALETERVRPDASHADTVMAVGSRAVSSMVLMRLRRMPPALTAVARAVAVLGEGPALPTVARLAELDEEQTASALTALSRAEVLRSEQPLGFVHPLVRDAVYRELPAGQRALQHQRAATVLREAGASDEVLAAHVLLAPTRGDQETVALLRRTARTAADRGAADSAVTYLRRALDEPVIGATRVEVLLELGLLETLVDGPAGTIHLEQAFPLLEEPALRGEIALSIARNHVFASDPGVASAFARTSRLSLPAEIVDARQGLLAIERIAAFMHALDGEWTAGEPPKVSGNRHGARMLAATLAWEKVVAGVDLPGAVQLGRQATADDSLFELDNGLFWVVGAISRVLADDDVGDFWERALAHAHRRGSLFAAMSANLWRGFLELRHGDLAHSEALLSAALEQQGMWQRDPNGLGAAYCDAFLVAVHLERGDLGPAREIAERALAGPLAGDGGRLVLDAQAALLNAEGRYAESLALLDSSVDEQRIPNPAWHPWRSLRAQALAGLGRRVDAIRLAEEELSLSRRWGAGTTVGRALRTLAEVRSGDTLPLLREAEIVLATTRSTLELARVRLALGRAEGVPDEEAVSLLLAARDGSQAAGATSLRDDVLQALRQRGHVAPEACADADQLTTTQRRVQELHDAGLDARAIAQQLFLTPGTVQGVLDSLLTGRLK